MNFPTAAIVNESVFQRGYDLSWQRSNDVPWQRSHDLSWLASLLKASALLCTVLLMFAAVQAQTAYEPTPGDEPVVIEGVSDTTALSMGRSLRINGTIKAPGGAIAIGGDVIVQGIVEGDVAAVGGSVIQLEGARIDGDVMVVGGSYRYLGTDPKRNPNSQTIMYAGYEQELRNLMRNPTDLLSPHWSAAYVGFRILAILFWFIVSLALTAAMPGTISRGVARLQLTSLRVAIIGFLAAVAVGPGMWLAMLYLPTPIRVVLGFMAFLLILVAWLFGRVIIYAATGRWLQRKFLKVGKNSEAGALLLGVIFWLTLSSLPYIWPAVVALVLVMSLGLALTARYRVGWKRNHVK